MTTTTQPLLEHYERSKHRLNRNAPSPGNHDWANQPNTFREFRGAPQIKQSFAANTLDTPYNDVRCGNLPSPRAFDLGNLAILFELSFGLETL